MDGSRERVTNLSQAEIEARLAVDLPGDDAPDDDSPDLSDPYWVERFRAAPLHPGESPPPEVKAVVNLPLSSDVLTHFQAQGPDWEDRIDAALRKAAGLDP